MNLPALKVVKMKMNLAKVTLIYTKMSANFISFADQNIDIIVKQFKTPLEMSGWNIPALKTEFLNLFNHVKKHISITLWAMLNLGECSYDPLM